MGYKIIGGTQANWIISIVDGYYRISNQLNNFIDENIKDKFVILWAWQTKKTLKKIKNETINSEIFFMTEKSKAEIIGSGKWIKELGNIDLSPYWKDQPQWEKKWEYPYLLEITHLDNRFFQKIKEMTEDERLKIVNEHIIDKKEIFSDLNLNKISRPAGGAFWESDNATQNNDINNAKNRFVSITQTPEKYRPNFWWVNQNQTYRQEIPGGFMWSPKKKKDGSKNTFYDNMTKVRPGDIVFSFYSTKIQYLGVIKSHGYDQSKPEFGSAGEGWETEGWMVNVVYRRLQNQIRPKDHIDELRPLLPTKYSPLQKNGNGNEVVYLTHIPENLAKKLLTLIGKDASPAVSESMEYQGDVKTDDEAEEERIAQLIKKDPEIPITEKETLIKARKGQGKFRDNVLSLHKVCPFTGVENPHCK